MWYEAARRDRKASPVLSSIDRDEEEASADLKTGKLLDNQSLTPHGTLGHPED